MKNFTTNADASYKEAHIQMQKQKDTTSVLNIHVEIVHASASLFFHDKISANRRISNISRTVLLLSSYVDRDSIIKLQQELLYLLTSVDNFHKYAETLTNGNAKTSLLQAINRYERDLDKAIKHCDKLMREITQAL